MQNAITFQTIGSTGEIYDIKIFTDGPDIRMTCTCANGTYDNTCYCKHRKAIIAGNWSLFLEVPPGAPEKAAALLNRASWINTHHDIEAREAELKKIQARLKSEIKALKKQVTQSMNGIFEP